MLWPSAKDKYWFCAHAITRPTCPRGAHWTPFCLLRQDLEPNASCGEHDQPYVGWVQADNPKRARKAIAAIYAAAAARYWENIAK